MPEPVYRITRKDPSNNALWITPETETAEEGVGWQFWNPLRWWSALLEVVDDETILLAHAPADLPESPVTLHAASIPDGVMWVNYDQARVLGIRESMELTLQISIGFGATLLTGAATLDSGSITVTGFDSFFLSEVGGPGAIAHGFFLCGTDGRWMEIASVANDATLTLHSNPWASQTEQPAWIMEAVQYGAIDVSAGQVAVTTDADVRGILSVGDWVQIVPSPEAGAPPAQIVSIDGTDGLSFVLDQPWPGDTDTLSGILLRGTAGLFPIPVDTPIGAGAWTSFYGSEGDTVVVTIEDT